MKNLQFILFTLLISSLSFSQNMGSKGINYKALIKDGDNNVLSNQAVTLQLSILEGPEIQYTDVVYTENHTTSTDANGIVIVNIGEGVPANGYEGEYDLIEWGSFFGSHFLNVQIDSGTGLTDLGTTEFKAVPYALFAERTNVSGLEMVNEGNASGWRLIGMNPENYGPIAHNAVDLSINYGPSTSHGATGNYATAVGYQTTASGQSSFASGVNTIASQSQATAMGAGTIASGVSSTAMGIGTRAQAPNSTAIGMYNVGGGSPLLAAATDPLLEVGNGHYVDGTNDIRTNALTILRNGTITAPSFDISEITDPKALITKEYADANYSFGGSGGTSTGLEAIDEGNGVGWRLVNRNPVNYGNIGVNAIDLSFSNSTSNTNGAIGTNSFASGLSVQAIGNYSVAMGFSTEAIAVYSTALGSQSNASGAVSTALGFGSTASGDWSTAIGYNTEASGENSTTMGKNTNASGNSATAMGENTIAYGLSSTAMGNTSLALGAYSVAMGNSAEASGENSIAMGYNALAPTENSIAMGKNTAASGNSSTAMGNATIASGSYSTAMGINTKATGESSTAMGNNTEASAYHSTAIGSGTKASGNYSTALGFDVDAKASASVALGRYNVGGGDSVEWVATDPLFEIGNGSSSTSHSNAFTVYKNGAATLSGTLTQNSDRRLKNKIKNLDYGLKEILNLKPVSYHWKRYPNQPISLGLIAQDVKTIINEIVHVAEDKDHTLSVSYTELIPVLIKAIQEQQVIIERQKLTISNQEQTNIEQSNVLQALLERVDALEKSNKTYNLELVKN